MPLKELFRAINVQRMKLGLPLISEERFIEEMSVYQILGKVEIKDGMVRVK
jgi:hypothetical protein